MVEIKPKNYQEACRLYDTARNRAGKWTEKLAQVDYGTDRAKYGRRLMKYEMYKGLESIALDWMSIYEPQPDEVAAKMMANGDDCSVVEEYLREKWSLGPNAIGEIMYELTGQEAYKRRPYFNA